MPAGRPAKFETADDLQQKIDDYFEYIEGDFNWVDDELSGQSRKVYERHPESPAITALALYLGFESRQSLYDYEKDGEFSYTIKRARLKIESFYEQNLLGKGVTGAIFALKNFGWKDKQEIDMKANVNLSDEDIVFE